MSNAAVWLLLIVVNIGTILTILGVIALGIWYIFFSAWDSWKWRKVYRNKD